MYSTTIPFEKGKTTSKDINDAFISWCPTVHISMELFAELMANIDKDVKGNLTLIVADNMITFEEK